MVSHFNPKPLPFFTDLLRFGLLPQKSLNVKLQKEGQIRPIHHQRKQQPKRREILCSRTRLTTRKGFFIHVDSCVVGADGDSKHHLTNLQLRNMLRPGNLFISRLEDRDNTPISFLGNCALSFRSHSCNSRQAKVVILTCLSG